MFLFHLLAGSLMLFAQPSVTQFNMYASISSTFMASSLKISPGCVAALNTTVNCDGNLFQMAGNADGYFWADDNATALCTNECLKSAASWWGQCANACEDDQLSAYGILYPAETVPGRFLDGLNIVCLTANTDVAQDVGINGTIISVTDIGGENSTVNSTGFADESSPDTPVERRQTPASSYCLVQSYNWVGSDIIRPDCDDSENANQSQCIDPGDVLPDNSRIANLYPDDLLCSECFLKMFYLRLASPYLPDLDHSDFMVDQWFDILDICNASSAMPELMVRTPPYYEAAPGLSIGGSSNATEYLADPLPLGANNTCSERVITFAKLDDMPPVDYSTQTPCDVIPPYLQASTADVQRMMGNAACLPGFNTSEIPSVCAPLPCEVVRMPANTTCDEFAQSISNATTKNQITITQFLSWNPNLIGLCSNTTAQYVCASAPGGTYVPPTVSNTTTSTGSQQRGGGDGSDSATGNGIVNSSDHNSTIIHPGQTPPSPTQSGIPATCTEYAKAQSGDGCDSFSSLFHITLQTLVTWNPVLGPNGANCQTDFWLGNYYCVGVSDASSATTATTSSSTPVVTGTATTTTIASAPGPTQSGITAACNKYAQAVKGDGCGTFATEHGIQEKDLYAWNAVLGSGGENCGTELWAGEFYCVGV